MCSISALDTPCLPHFGQLPSSQSNPATLPLIAWYYTNVYTRQAVKIQFLWRDRKARRSSGADISRRSPRTADVRSLVGDPSARPLGGGCGAVRLAQPGPED